MLHGESCDKVSKYDRKINRWTEVANMPDAGILNVAALDLSIYLLIETSIWVLDIVTETYTSKEFGFSEVPK
jgi:hypothetical protein